MMIVIGIDPASSHIAFVFDTPGANRLAHFEFKLGAPYRPVNTQRAMSRTVEVVSSSSSEMVAFIEAPVMGKGGAKSTMVQSFVSGAIQATLLDLGVEVHLVNVSTWKKSVVGKGNASKPEVAAWVDVHYPYFKKESQDVKDATCLAVYGRQVMERAIKIDPN